MKFVQVAVNIPQLNGVFDYHLPPALEDKAAPGCLVTVPFGRQTAQGVILRFIDQPSVPETKAVETLLDPQPALTACQMQLAEWMSKQYLAPLPACLDEMLPPGLSQQVDSLYTPVENASAGQALSPTQKRLLERLKERGPQRGRQFDQFFRHVDWRSSAQGLLRQGMIVSQSVLPPPGVRPLVARTAQLIQPLAAAVSSIRNSRASTAQERRIKALQFLAGEAAPVDVTWVYAASNCSLPDLKLLEEMELISLGETETYRDPLQRWEFTPQQAPVLTPDQERQWETIHQSLFHSAKAVKPLLLVGVTGSGKTELYLRAVAEVVAQGKQAIILVPEISLTPQTVKRFMGRFPGQVGLVHSRLSPGERYDTWRRARLGRLPVIVGPRSALFTPLPDLGLIVVDECHDGSYYQDNTFPAYSAVDLAVALSTFARSTLILGSATPSVEVQYRAQQEKWQVLTLPRRVLAHKGVAAQADSLEGIDISELPLPPVQVVDMREELKNGNRSIFSQALRDGLQDVLDKKQQAILFLNRRGSATYVFCRTCGKSLDCPKCLIPLTFHTDESMLICHRCNYRRQMPRKCPACGSDQIRQYGMGTEKVVEELGKAFPQAQIVRYDAETTAAKGSHDVLLTHFLNHKADVLVGTQMLAKGLDMPLVTLVGIVLADVGLNLPDFRAAERGFQLLTQVAGRAGRSPLGGKVVMQTFLPEHYAIRYAAGHDLTGFTAAELEKRRELGYPPFSRLVRLLYHHAMPGKAEEEANKMAASLQNWVQTSGHTRTEIIGPAPCFYARLNGQYRWQIILRGPDPAPIVAGKPLGDWRVQVDPVNLL